MTENNGFLIPARDSAEALAFCEMYAKSAFCPKAYQGKPQELYICCVFGARLGMDPISASQNVAVVNGKPSIYGDALKGLVIGYCSKFIERFDESTGTAICEIHRKGLENPVIATFSWNDAQTAGLTERQVWKAYPKRMLQMRARGFAIRDAFPDKIAGLITKEEAEDYAPQNCDMPRPQTPVIVPAESDPQRIEQKRQDVIVEPVTKTEKVMNMLGVN